MANMKLLLLAAALIGAVSAAKECKVPHCVTDQWSLTRKSCAVVGPTATPEGAGVCGFYNGPMFKKGDKFSDLALLKTRTTGYFGEEVGPWEKCNCVDKYEAAPDGYTAAYSVMCAGRLEDTELVPGVQFPAHRTAGMTGRNTTLYGKGEGATAEKCASKCTAMEGCGGFNFNYYDDQMTCNAIGWNKFCGGPNSTWISKKGTERKEYPEGPGGVKGLVEGHVGFAVFMSKRSMIFGKYSPGCWNEQGRSVYCSGGSRAGEDQEVCQPGHTMTGANQFGVGERCVANGAGGGPKYASASLVALAVAAAAAVKMC